MSGLVRGKIECAIPANNRQDETQVYFKNLYDFFTSHPNYTLIALQYGSTTNLPNSTSSGTGTNYYDQANSFGYNAFFVVRANATTARPFDVYYLFQWGGSSNQSGATTVIGQSPGAPALIQNGTSAGNTGVNMTGLMCQAAIGIGGTGGSAGSPNNGNPWKGTQNGNGADTKGNPVWGAPPGGGTGAMVFPRSNNGNAGSGQQVGAHQQSRQNGGSIYGLQSDTQPTRMNIVADDDCWAIFTDYNDTGTGSPYLAYAGLYVPRPNIAQNIPYPFCTIFQWTNIPISVSDQSIWGDVAGTSSQQGGIAMPNTGSVGQLQLDYFQNNFAVDANFAPDKQIPGNPYNEWPIWVGVFEPWPVPMSGYLGQIEFIKIVYGVATNDVKSDFSRIFFGTTTLASQKISFPWDSQNNTVPRSGATRAGVTFVTNLGGGI